MCCRLRRTTSSTGRRPPRVPLPDFRRAWTAGRPHSPGTNGGYLPDSWRRWEFRTNTQVLVFSKPPSSATAFPRRTRAPFITMTTCTSRFVPGSPAGDVHGGSEAGRGVLHPGEQAHGVAEICPVLTTAWNAMPRPKPWGAGATWVRSFQTDDHGITDLLTGTEVISHRTPLSDRWGGWFVTGEHGSQTHRGNLVGNAAFERQA